MRLMILLVPYVWKMYGQQISCMDYCGHAYHASCLEKWLLAGRFLCPLCNQAFFDQNEPVSSLPEILYIVNMPPN
jgi:hypothetical protein